MKEKLNSWKSSALGGWDLMRGVRLVLAVLVIIDSMVMHEYVISLLGGVMLFQTLTNTGCCAGGACYSDPIDKQDLTKKEVVYEEIKNN